MFKKYIDKIYDRIEKKETMHEIVGEMSCFIEKIKDSSPELYDDIMCYLEEYLYDITLKEAKDIVENMCNEYGDHGERWSYEEICEIANKYDLPDTINRCELYIVMNMWNIDYKRTMEYMNLLDNLDAYIMFSCDWLTDSDFGKGKVYKYFIKLHNKERN